MFQTKILEKIKTHLLFSVIFFPKILPFKTWCEKKNIVEPGRQEMTIGTSALHGEYLRLQIHTYCFSIAAVVERARLSVTLYVPCLSVLKQRFFYGYFAVIARFSNTSKKISHYHCTKLKLNNFNSR